jgi:hypothetical protein
MLRRIEYRRGRCGALDLRQRAPGEGGRAARDAPFDKPGADALVSDSRVRRRALLHQSHGCDTDGMGASGYAGSTHGACERAGLRKPRR